jgi:hypothetical protein
VFRFVPGRQLLVVMFVQASFG